MEEANESVHDVHRARTILPIGFVRNDVEGPERPEWAEIESDLVIDPRWTEALEGLGVPVLGPVEDRETIAVLWWFSRREGEEVPMKIHPRGDRNNPLTGLFATRAPIRPNLIALTTVEVLGRDDNVVHVRGLDAFNGTPILDLKPA